MQHFAFSSPKQAGYPLLLCGRFSNAAHRLAAAFLPAESAFFSVKIFFVDTRFCQLESRLHHRIFSAVSLVLEGVIRNRFYVLPRLFVIQISDRFGITLVEFKKFVCTYGGYALDEYKTENKKRKGTSYGMQKIMDILDCLGVSHWEDLKGKYVRCEYKKSGEIIRIGNIIEDKWFLM